MEKKDYQNLMNKYSFLADYENRYRKELLDFIHEAFEKHGNEFEYKCLTHESWQAKNKDIEAEFDAMSDLPVCLTIWVDDDGGHEVYPTHIRQYTDGSGGKQIEADGYDWYDCSWLKYQQVHATIDELQSIAQFIHAVLEQEAETEETRQPIGYQLLDENDNIPDGLFSFQVFRAEQDAKDFMAEENLSGCTIVPIYEGDVEEPTFIGKKPRTFKQGERVFNCEYSGGDRDLHAWATVCSDTEVEYDDDIVLIEMENGGENETTADSLYQLAEGKVCPRCDGPLCIEHHEEIDYPYFCPECDENFYNIEV